MDNERSSQVNEAVTAAATAAMRRFRADRKMQGPQVIMPGGRVHSAVPYLQNAYRTQKQATTFSDIDVNPDKYLKDHKPGYRYVWIPKDPKRDPDAHARVASGRYREVTSDRMKPDSDLPFVPGTPTIAGKTHTGARNTVEIYDLLLCEVSPKNWEELFAVREAMGVAKIASNTEQFYANMESEGAVGSVEISTDAE